jgi:hypothetical protein
VIFGYDVRDICEHLLEKIGSISMARSSGTSCELVALLLDRTGRQRKIEFICTLWNEKKEENAWELVWCGRGCLGVLL